MSAIPPVTPTHGARLQFVVQPHRVATLSSRGTPDGRGPASHVEISDNAQAALKARESGTPKPGDGR